MNTPKPTSKMKSVTTALLASTMALSVFAFSPNTSNIISFPQAHAEAVRVEAPQAPSFADVVEAVSPAVVSVRVEGSRERVAERGFRFDRRDRGERGERGNRRERGERGFDRRRGDNDLPRFFRDNPEFGERFFGQRRDRSERQRPRGNRRGGSQGSGFFVSDDGYVVTNQHVIENGTKFTIVMNDGTEMPAELVGADKRSDLAVLKVSTDKKLTYVSFGEKDPRIGDWVVAVGNPFGLGGTVTAGIVSARGREIGANRYDDFIQIDAAVNKGNSGGPAFNLNGQVVGVNTAIFSPSGGNVGIAFAIPAAVASEIVEDLIGNGKVVRGWLGVQIQPVSQDIAESLGLENATGAIVTDPQSNSPATKAGIKSGDVITAVDGKEVDGPRSLARMIAGYDPESEVTISIWRNGKSEDVSVNLGTLSEGTPMASTSQDGEPASIGIILQVAPNGEGVVVMDVLPESPAEEKGIQVGDVITSVNGEEVKQPGDVSRIVSQAKELGRKATLFQVERDGNSNFVAVPLPKG